ncbi:MAG: hypothetical protein KJZ93_11360 [Caldilineaceae bacterium]|nr:hypothetical protein [Caldilineaceae bacterium]
MHPFPQRPQAQHLAIQQRRRKQNTPALQQTYAKRAGIEGARSLAVRTTGLRRARLLRPLSISIASRTGRRNHRSL